jgi:hypothetical protein
MKHNRVKDIARKSYFILTRLLKVLILRFSHSAIRRLVKNLYISYDSGAAVDGTGAQLQRLISVAALSNFFGLNYLPSKIENFSVHALDPFQSDKDYLDQLVRLNQFLTFPNIFSIGPESAIEKVYISKLTIRKFLFEIFKQILKPSPRTLVVLEVYPVSEFCPGVFTDFGVRISEGLQPVGNVDGHHLVVHYRQGVGGNVIYPGQKIPRQIEFNKIVDVISDLIRSKTANPISQITILTDAPNTISFYTPPENQRVLWEGTPGYSDGIMTIQPMDFSELHALTNLPLLVIRGGNPLDAIKVMAVSDVLIMSKSSLSYVGALLNTKGIVYCPRSFWHNPLGSWVKYDG